MSGIGFFSQTLDEIKGIYTPGRKPVIFCGDQSIITPDVSIQHENSHRWLCDNSSFGQYLTILVNISRYSTDSMVKKHAEPILDNSIESCWITHEGSATASQFNHCIVSQRTDLLNVEDYLPGSYIEALKNFILSQKFIIELLESVGIKGNDRSFLLYYYQVIQGYVEILALAAMSLPMADILSDANDPISYDVACQIRKNTPDTRLLKILDALNSNFVRYAIIEYMNIVNEHIGGGCTITDVADLTKELSRHLCAKAKLPFELDSQVDIGNILAQYYDLDPEEDVNRITDDDLIYETTKRALIVGGTNNLCYVEGLNVKVGKDVYKNALKHFELNEYHVVCELLPLDIEQAEFRACLHVFIEKDNFLSYISNNQYVQVSDELLETYRKLDEHAAIQFILIFMNINDSELKSLKSDFPSSGWSWLLGEPFYIYDELSAISKYIESTKDNVYISKIMTDDKLPFEYTNVPASPAAANAFFANAEGGQVDREKIIIASPDQRFLQGVPYGLLAQCYEIDGKDKHVREIMLTASERGGLNGQCNNSFIASCVAMATYQGLNSSLLQMIASK